MSYSVVAGGAGSGGPTGPTRSVYLRLADEMDTNLQEQILRKWFPRAIDAANGGFFQNFNEDWSPGQEPSRALVYESRLTWTAAQAARRFPAEAAMYTAAARHGVEFLATRMWDRRNGGLFWAVDVGAALARGRGGNDATTKQAYGHSFVIYAGSTAYLLTGDSAALDLAHNTFAWYDKHGHDAKHGGYFEVLTAEGKPALNITPAVGGGPGSKSMNSTIHMLEALTSLYEVWPDPTVRARLDELFQICRDCIAVEPGYMVQYFSLDWKARENEDSYGHDVEAGYLLAEAAKALGIPEDPKTWAVAKQLVDHAMDVGWDKQNGGLYNSGGIDGGNYSQTREWWVHAEFLNALLLMHERFGKEDQRYWNIFIAQWEWINKYGIDRVHGGWWPRVNNDGTPIRGPKSDSWTECYHQGRSMMNVSERLRRLAGNDR